MVFLSGVDENKTNKNKVLLMVFRKAYRALIFSCTGLLLSGAVYADKSEWELGIGMAALDVPFYPGSSQSETYVFPVPYFLYRSEKLEIDNGVDATLLKTPRTRFNLSADFAVPVNSADSTSRAGMPDLDVVIQLGPSLEITLAGGRFKPSHTRLELPVRAAIATDLSSADSVGWIFEPRLTYESRRPYKTGFAQLISGGVRVATEDLNQYYYGVEAAYVTQGRPQYDAPAGYSGLFVDYIANWRSKDFIFWALLRYQNLDGAAFEDSPLIEQEDYLLYGAGFTWVFARNL
jgi:outer membrane scaffolding protein for murein synthesis (MipA/OmpV family)